VIRRKSRDIERLVGCEAFERKLHRRGYHAVENAGQIVIYCNYEPIQVLR